VTGIDYFERILSVKTKEFDNLSKFVKNYGLYDQLLH